MLLYKEVSTAEELASQLLRAVFTYHGIPDEIISDRDKLFISKFWTTITALLGIKRKLSTAFYPQTDGQTERINQTMEVYLRYYVNYKQDNWVEELKALHEELSSDIKFIVVWSATYYNKKHSIGPALKEGEKVYLLRKNMKI